MHTILHGGDYNPEQWLNYPGIIDDDFRLFRQARLNSITIGVFSWAALEPEEGSYRFEWMDDIFDRAEKQDMKVILATPSGGKPNWLALKYPEVRRVSPEGVREPQQKRHNHCLTSPVYREKVLEINTRLAERYGGRSSLALWHISNEFGGYCYCDLCLGAFQRWLEAKYRTLEALNEAYWSRFWSHTYTAWDQIRTIDQSVCGLVLDWRRFMTHQCRDFIRHEAKPLREKTPRVPITTNFMGFYDAYNYWELAKELDLISWDSYPAWHLHKDDPQMALETAIVHDIYRPMKGGKPFLLMETTPSQVNWTGTSPLRRPGLHRTHSLQAIAHGSNAVCYFQMRQSRGSMEQFHGAVISHHGHENTRVFREVTELGATLEKLSEMGQTRIPAKGALFFDWENRWALEISASPQNKEKRMLETLREHYAPFWKRGIPVDVIDSETGLDAYALVVAPMAFMLRNGQSERMERYVENGGTLVVTYQSGVVDETMLCFQGGAPGPLRKLLGLWVEEFDALQDEADRRVIAGNEAGHGLLGVYKAKHYVEIVHLEGAQALAAYGDDFYTGKPALTVNSFGKGRAYYVASRNDERFNDDFFGFLARDLGVASATGKPLPKGVSACRREIEQTSYLFLMNFTANSATVKLDEKTYKEVDSGEQVIGEVLLPPYGSKVLI